jgi:hypothetical protein
MEEAFYFTAQHLPESLARMVQNINGILHLSDGFVKI